VPCSHKFAIAVIRPSSVGMVPCRLLLPPPLQMPTQQHHPSETLIDMPSGGSACQRVPCSHKYVSAVIRPSSVGIVPVNPRLLKSLPGHHPNLQSPVSGTIRQSRFAPAFVHVLWRSYEFENS
jgi:hypothetical protein